MSDAIIQIMLVLLLVPPLIIALMVPVGDWLKAREERKKAAEAAAEADGASPAPAASPA